MLRRVTVAYGRLLRRHLLLPLVYDDVACFCSSSCCCPPFCSHNTKAALLCGNCTSLSTLPPVSHSYRIILLFVALGSEHTSVQRGSSWRIICARATRKREEVSSAIKS